MAGFPNNQDNLVTIGRVIKPWGNAGELLVEPLTFNPDRFFLLKGVFFIKDNDMQCREIEGIRKHSKNLIIKIAGCCNFDDADRLRHFYIKIDKSESPKLPEGQYYYYELEGINVQTINGEMIGSIVSIMQAGETDVYVIKDEHGKETLIPAIKDSILSIDVVNKKMVVKPLEMI